MNRKIRSGLQIGLVLIIIIIVFRRPIYNWSIKYFEVGIRTNIPIENPELIQHINAEELPDDISFHEIASISNSLTSELLAFSKSNASYNIVGMMNTRKANCVGYARMFNAIANYLIRENDLGDQIIAQHKIGKLSLWGIDLHSIINRPFFQDHDYNEIKDLHTGESLFVDPSLSDYLGIDFVREHK